MKQIKWLEKNFELMILAIMLVVSKCWNSISCPIATIRVWHGTKISGSPVARTLALPPLILLIICGVT